MTGVKRVFVEGEDCDDWMVVDMGEWMGVGGWTCVSEGGLR